MGRMILISFIASGGVFPLEFVFACEEGRVCVYIWETAR